MVCQANVQVISVVLKLGLPKAVKMAIVMNSKPITKEIQDGPRQRRAGLTPLLALRSSDRFRVQVYRGLLLRLAEGSRLSSRRDRKRRWPYGEPVFHSRAT
jgi:hypothetical protein